jgi:DNA-directed RNA polymerase specialized sigma subunit
MKAIPSIKLSPAEEQEYSETMRKGGLALQECASIMKMDHREFRSKLFKNTLDFTSISPEEKEKIQKAIPVILEIRKIEDKILKAFVRLCNKHARIWAGRVCGAIVSREDYFQEALAAVVDAMYSFTRENVRFITYLWYVIHNRLATAANKNNPFGPLTNQALKLLQRFENAKLKMNRSHSNVEIYEQLNLTEEEIGILEHALVKVHPYSNIGETTDYLDEAMDWDYTSQRRGIDLEKDTVSCDFEINEAKDRADLSDLERKVLDTFLMPHYGWQEEIASETISPKTNMRYTRQAISCILKSALKKVKAAYLRKTAS